MNSVKLSCSTGVYIDISLTEAIRQIATIGYAGIEIQAGHEKTLGDISYEETVSRIKKELGSHNVKVANITIPASIINSKMSDDSAYPDHSNGSLWDNRPYIDMIKHYARLAMHLGCGSISISPGRITGDGDTGDQIASMQAGITEVTKFARNLGVTTGILYGPWLAARNAEHLKPLLFKCRGLKISFHVGNSHLACETPCQIAADFKHQISHIHIADAGCSDRIYLVPGSGEIEWISFFRTLHWIGYRSFVSVDLSPYRDQPNLAATRAYYYLSNIINGLRSSGQKRIA